MPKTNSGFIRNFAENRFAEMKRDLGFGINSIWYRLKQLKITLKKVALYRERSNEERQNFIEKIAKIRSAANHGNKMK